MTPADETPIAGQKVGIKALDAEVERILAMSDEEILASVDDPYGLAQKWRKRLNRILAHAATLAELEAVKQERDESCAKAERTQIVLTVERKRVAGLEAAIATERKKTASARRKALIEGACIVEEMAEEWPDDAERLQQAANRIRCRANIDNPNQA